MCVVQSASLRVWRAGGFPGGNVTLESLVSSIVVPPVFYAVELTSILVLLCRRARDQSVGGGGGGGGCGVEASNAERVWMTEEDEEEEKKIRWKGVEGD